MLARRRELRRHKLLLHELVEFEGLSALLVAFFELGSEKFRRFLHQSGLSLLLRFFGLRRREIQIFFLAVTDQCELLQRSLSSVHGHGAFAPTDATGG